MRHVPRRDDLQLVVDHWNEAIESVAIPVLPLTKEQRHLRRRPGVVSVHELSAILPCPAKSGQRFPAAMHDDPVFLGMTRNGQGLRNET
jgi:hypothetical protein